jgi:type I restriction enzyme S subunit
MDLNNYELYETDEKITELALKETSCSIIPKYSVLVAMYGGFNQIGRTGLMMVDASINQALSAIILKPNKANSKFLLYWLNSKVLLWRNFAASSRKDPNITKKDVELFPVSLPPLLEQQKIAEVLTKWDNAIEATEKLLEIKQKRKKELMKGLLTGNLRFPAFASHERKTVKLKDYLKESSVKNNKNQMQNVLSVTNSRGFINQDEQFERSIASKDLKAIKLSKKVSLLIIHLVLMLVLSIY